MLTEDADEIAYDLAIVAASIADGAPTCAALLREAAQALTAMTTARNELFDSLRVAMVSLHTGSAAHAERVLRRAYIQHQEVSDEPVS